MEIMIRKAEPDDYPSVQAIHAMPKVYSGTLQLPLPSKALWKVRLSESSENVHFYIAEVEGEIVGFAGLNVMQNVRRKHVASFWITIHDDWHDRGIGTQLTQEIIQIADNWLGIVRIELTVFTDNASAIKLYEKFGFQGEGIHRKYAFRNGEYQDVLAMARINTNMVI